MAKEIEKVQPEKVFLTINGEEREIKFGFSAWAKLEKEFGGIENLEKQLQEKIAKEPFSIIPHLIYIGLVNKEGVDEENVLDDYGLGDVEFIATKLMNALYGALPIEESKKEVEAKKKRQ